MVAVGEEGIEDGEEDDVYEVREVASEASAGREAASTLIVL